MALPVVGDVFAGKCATEAVVGRGGMGVVFAADGNADAVIDPQHCVASVIGRPLELVASLSNSTSHDDRMPLVQSTVTITRSRSKEKP
jgi:hypothetical protein